MKPYHRMFTQNLSTARGNPLVKENVRLTLRLRLFLLLIIFVSTLLMGLVAILLTTGIIDAGMKESEAFIKKEHSDISSHVAEYYSGIAAEAVGFSRILSLNIEARLREKGLSFNDVKSDPQLLEKLIEDELYQVLMYMNRSKSSGAFIILDATVNTRLPGSDKSKAGIYLKNMEPNIVNSTSPTIYVLRGSPDTAYKNSLPLHPEWKMEFDVSNAPFYSLPVEKASENKHSLSRLYFWSPSLILPGTSEEIMICSVPLIDSSGNVFGVCGLDISSMLFKLTFMPDSSMYSRIFCMLSPLHEGGIFKTNESLFSGGYTAISTLSSGNFTTSDRSGELNMFRNGNSAFAGYYEYIKMYPENSAFADEPWILSLMVPQKDLQSNTSKTNMKLFSVCFVFIALGLTTSFLLSRYYIKPIHEAIDSAKQSPGTYIKTNIPEIDELINFISLRNENYSIKNESSSDSQILNEFSDNLKTLSPAERSVFNLYAQDYSAKEIAEELYLSINTIKTHTKHIYSKLFIKSREELLLYVEMMKESGRSIK